MNSKNIIFALGGLAAGAGAMYLAMRERCEKRINDEVAEVKKYYQEKYENSEKEAGADENQVMKEVADEAGKPEPNYKEIIDKLNYNRYSTEVKNYDEVKEAVIDKPYIISMDEYNDDIAHTKVMLTYFSDDILIDNSTDDIIDDVGGTVGFDNLDQFGTTDDEFELYVRNDKLGIDYYISLETISYKDYIGGVE